MSDAGAKYVVLCLIAGVLSGCASTPPSTFYTLSPMPAERLVATARDGIGVGLGPVTFPVFLDRPQIVSRETGNRLEVDEFNRWGGTLQDDFLRVWSENLGMLLGTSRIMVFPSEIRYPIDFRVAADILAFEGTPEGKALLKVRWTVLDASVDQVLSVQATAYERPLATSADENALIGALSETLGDFSRDVAAALDALPRAKLPRGEGAEPLSD